MRLPIPQNVMANNGVVANNSSYHHHHQNHPKQHHHSHARYNVNTGTTTQQKHLPLFRRDFIIVAEFCEQKGPTPLLVLPNDRVLERFNIQKFVTRVLAGDHTRKHDKLGDNCTWICPEDTQVYLTDSAQGAFAYVHHITLHDINARGYVRPMVMCYVTNDKDKIMHHFEYLLNTFTQISQTLKYGNNCKFLSDTQHQLNGIQKMERKLLATTTTIGLTNNNSENELSSPPPPPNITTGSSSPEQSTEEKSEKRWREMSEGLFSPSNENALSKDTFELVLKELKDLRRRFMLHMNKSSSLLKPRKKSQKIKKVVSKSGPLQNHTYLFEESRSRSTSNSSQSTYGAGSTEEYNSDDHLEISSSSMGEHSSSDYKVIQIVHNSNNNNGNRLEESDSNEEFDEESTEAMLNKIVDEETLDSGLIDHIYMSFSAGASSVSSLHLHPTFAVNPKANVNAVPYRTPHFAGGLSGASVGAPTTATTSAFVPSTLHQHHSNHQPNTTNLPLPMVNVLNDISDFPYTMNSASSPTIYNPMNSLKQQNPDFVELYEAGLSVSSYNLKQFMPTILRCIHRNTNFETTLRTLSQIAGHKFYETSVDLMLNIIEHFYRDCDVIDMENADLDIINSNDLNSMLFIGRNFLLDFNIENGYHYPPTMSSSTFTKSLNYQSALNTTNSSNDEASWLDNENTYNDFEDEALSTISHDEQDNPIFGSLNSTFPSSSPVMVVANNSTTEHSNSLSTNNNDRFQLYRNGFKGTGSYVGSLFQEYERYDELFQELKKRKRNSNSSGSGGINSGSNGQNQSLLTSLLFEYNYGEQSYGKGILRFFRELSFTKDIAYSIMIGRPLVIYAEPSQEQIVRSIVNSLALFIPGFINGTFENTKNDYFTVCYWKTSPINILDFSTNKIVGLSKKVPLPTLFESWISILDLENEVFTGPSYYGRYLDIIFDESKEWFTEDAFLAFTHTIFLEMGMKASLYNQLYSIAKTRGQFYKKSLHKISTTDQTPKDGGRSSLFGPMFPSLPPQMIHKQPSQSSKKSKQKKTSQHQNGFPIGSGALESMKDCSRTIQRQLGLKSCDSKIVDYLVDLIHIQESMELLSNSIIQNSLRVDTEVSLKHTNKRKKQTK